MEQTETQLEPAAVSAATAIDKAIDVLFHLHQHGTPQGVSDIGRALGLPKSSAHRLLRALCRRELVERDTSGRYHPGAALIGLALAALDREPLIAAARGILETHARALAETFFLVAARGGRLLVLDKAEGPGVLRASPAVGSAVPVHASAVGKLFLAHAPERVRLEQPLPRYTRKTLVSPRTLARAVQVAAAAGHAQSRGEWIDEMSVFAAPVFARGELVAAVCAAVPGARVLRVPERKAISHVTEAAAQLGARLSGGGQRT
jgi:IclR family transcriptional regulator, acetate operon repressor